MTAFLLLSHPNVFSMYTRFQLIIFAISTARTAQHDVRFPDKIENQIFLIYKEIQEESSAKSYVTNGLLVYG